MDVSIEWRAIDAGYLVASIESKDNLAEMIISSTIQMPGIFLYLDFSMISLV